MHTFKLWASGRRFCQVRALQRAQCGQCKPGGAAPRPSFEGCQQALAQLLGGCCLVPPRRFALLGECWPRCARCGAGACQPPFCSTCCKDQPSISSPSLPAQGMLATLHLVRRQDLLAYTFMALRGQKDVLELEVRCAVLRTLWLHLCCARCGCSASASASARRGGGGLHAALRTLWLQHQACRSCSACCPRAAAASGAARLQPSWAAHGSLEAALCWRGPTRVGCILPQPPLNAALPPRCAGAHERGRHAAHGAGCGPAPHCAQPGPGL